MADDIPDDGADGKRSSATPTAQPAKSGSKASPPALRQHHNNATPSARHSPKNKQCVLAGSFSAVFLAVTLLASALQSGCAMTLSPPEHRARQYSTAFAAYPAETQERLRDATIAAGDDRTAVYIALGKPQGTRIGYDRDAVTGKAIRVEYWEYSGYPTGKAEGQFVTLNNGGFASPFGTKPYGKVVVRFGNAKVCDYSYDATQEASGNGGSGMMVPPDPHR